MGDVPENANQNCPGTSSDEAGKAAACQGCPNQAVCATAPKGPDPDLEAIALRMSHIKNKILVLSGKGGVGKSTFAAQLAFALAEQGKEVGLLDIDICGPSVPKMLGLEGEEVHQSNLGWSPVYVQENLGVMSIGFMLSNPDDAVIWRGPRKNGLIKQFLKDVDWGKLDYLVVDAPPGTSDEHISIAQFLRAGSLPSAAVHSPPAPPHAAPATGRNAANGVDVAVIVTTPQEVSIIDVRKEVSFCRKVGLQVVGVVENMAGLQLPLSNVRFEDRRQPPGSTGWDITAGVLEKLAAVLGEVGLGVNDVVVGGDVFLPSGGGAAKMCEELGLRLLGRVPLDPRLGQAAESGKSVFEAAADAREVAPSAAALQQIVQQLLTAAP